MLGLQFVFFNKLKITYCDNFQTGTLTEDGLDMWGVVPSEYGHFKPPAKQLDTLKSGNLLYAMVTCHSLTIIDDKIAGDPLDLKV